MEKYFDEKIKKLGFGLMRLPRKGVAIDIEKTSKMVDLFLEKGFTYFDTAFVYPGSEAATKKALVDRHPRESFILATKIYASLMPTAKMAKSELDTSIKKTGAGYIDFYLLHSLMENNYEKYDKYGIWDFVKEEKAKGRIKHYGFSFHGGPELLDQLLTDHPDTELVQLQLNYADWENPKIRSREVYEVARKHGKPIVVMEPVRGGKLANPPQEVKEIFDEVNPGASYASWAIRFAASLDGILTVLSGMSNLEQMENNLSYMNNFQPLNEAEQEAIRRAQKVFYELKEVLCTACGYCREGCPKQIPIPEIFAVRNKQLSTGQLEDAKTEYKQVTSEATPEASAGATPEASAGATSQKSPIGKASDCIGCGKCEAACPQKIDIIEQLKTCADMFEQ